MTDERPSLLPDADPWEPTRRFFTALDELRVQDPNPKLYRFKGCAACDGDPEAHDLHVCGKEPFS